ncbi:hypothetical protein T492DRAFT_854290 [Pavlovales sp. CCMP2436]|nr:hypothetical protein T492DRAFT_854290 [Pavlovales sp. CCMP2436]
MALTETLAVVAAERLARNLHLALRGLPPAEVARILRIARVGEEAAAAGGRAAGGLAAAAWRSPHPTPQVLAAGSDDEDFEEPPPRVLGKAPTQPGSAARARPRTPLRPAQEQQLPSPMASPMAKLAAATDGTPSASPRTSGLGEPLSGAEPRSGDASPREGKRRRVAFALDSADLHLNPPVLAGALQPQGRAPPSSTEPDTPSAERSRRDAGSARGEKSRSQLKGTCLGQREESHSRAAAKRQLRSRERAQRRIPSWSAYAEEQPSADAGSQPLSHSREGIQPRLQLANLSAVTPPDPAAVVVLDLCSPPLSPAQRPEGARKPGNSVDTEEATPEPQMTQARPSEYDWLYDGGLP